MSAEIFIGGEKKCTIRCDDELYGSICKVVYLVTEIHDKFDKRSNDIEQKLDKIETDIKYLAEYKKDKRTF